MEKSTLFVTLARLALRELLPESAGGVVDAIQGYLGDQSQALALVILPANTLIGECQTGHFAPRTQPLTAGLSL